MPTSAGGYFKGEELEVLREEAQTLDAEGRYYLVREGLFEESTARHPMCGPRPGDEPELHGKPWDLIGIRWGIIRILAFGIWPEQVLGCDGPSKVDSKYPATAAADGWNGPRRLPDLRPLCPDCGLPVFAEDGRTRQTKQQVMPKKGCDTCGWRLPYTRMPGFTDGLDPTGIMSINHEIGIRGREAGRAHLAARTPEERTAIARLGGAATAAKKMRVTHIMEQRAEDLADRVIKPYFDALELEPDPDWSPSTKLRFFSEQTNVADKILNRVEGLPVARTRDEGRAAQQAETEMSLENVPGHVVVEALSQVLGAAAGAGYSLTAPTGDQSKGNVIEGKGLVHEH